MKNIKIDKGVVSMILLLVLVSYSSVTPTNYTFPTLPFFPKMPSSVDNPVTEEGVELGRYLFYDPILSKDSTISCASCHQQEYAFTDGNNVKSIGVNGFVTDRHTMPLFNLAWSQRFFWDGRSQSIENQVLHPIREEMGGNWELVSERIRSSDFYQKQFRVAFGNEPIDSSTITKAIGQFERTILSYQSKYDKVLRGEATFTEEEFQGFVMVNEQNKGNCMHCHVTDAHALGTTGEFSNNGLDEFSAVKNAPDQGLGKVTKQSKDIGKFKIPSLRNIALTAPYMHDGRFQTLEEVINFYNEEVALSPTLDHRLMANHHGNAHLTEKEKTQVIAFLHTLTDSVLIQSVEFANPFE